MSGRRSGLAEMRRWAEKAEGSVEEGGTTTGFCVPALRVEYTKGVEDPWIVTADCSIKRIEVGWRRTG